VLEVDELLELLELELLEPAVPEPEVLEELDVLDVLDVFDVLEPEPDDDDCVLDDAVAGVAARYITDRTSSSMRRRMDRAKSVRSTSSWPAVE
jgi:hypothetical protein